MYPEPTPPGPPPVQVQSISHAPSWGCTRCGHVNTPAFTSCFLVSRFCCARCGARGTHDFDFLFSSLKINGIAIMPPVRDQGNHPTCTAHASLAAMEIVLREQAARAHQVFTETLSWEDVISKYETKKGCRFNTPQQGDKCWGRLMGVLNVVLLDGVVDQVGRLYRIRSWNWYTYNNMPFDQVCAVLAEGIPVLTVIPFMRHMLHLKESDVYSTQGYPVSDIIEYHVVVLIGGRRESERDMYWFLDSHGGHFQVNGIAKIFLEECVLGYGVLQL